MSAGLQLQSVYRHNCTVVTMKYEVVCMRREVPVGHQSVVHLSSVVSKCQSSQIYIFRPCIVPSWGPLLTSGLDVKTVMKE